ncbi:sensor histidine kinase [Pelagibacterium xiamenense]|uniref:sensor histidine kinase n=1 Tax=Pelagibacterium xiamenense TaxID=2901140 RepID=UPI001E31F12A|nr:sensor histidine kinase [Pelagibacterium xiamenense]MCD7058551.1 sensor histidine kinase [Pelagibacterium xiamenense]
MPILNYLTILVLVIVLPVLTFAGVLIQRHNEAQEDTVETFTVATTRSVMQAVEREISGMITTLRVLMTSESLVDGNLARFHAHAQDALAGTGANLIVINRAYEQLLNTRVSFGEPLGLMSDPESANRSFESPDAIVSDLFWGETAADWVFNVMLRRPNAEPADHVVILTQAAANLSNALLTRELPEGWHVALVDSDNRVISASRESAVVGEPFFLPLLHTEGASRRWNARTIGGEDYMTITQGSILAGWYVVAWAPVSVVTGPLRVTLVWLVFGGLAIAGLAAFAAAVVARQIARSVRGLARQARRLGAGETVDPVAYPVYEIAQVSEALFEAAERRKKAEAEARFLMRELAHRSKNQLTVISAMAKQTAHGTESVSQFVESFQNRIYGLARSTDLLLAHGTGGIELRDLFKTQIDPFRPEDPARVHKTGPVVRLNVQAAQVLGMAAHEMATNAAKYGAFSGPGGRLRVNWEFKDDGRLHISWREFVPDFATPGDGKGFGTVVLKTMVAGSLGADVERMVHEDGIEWVFAIPRESLDPQREQAGIEDDD